MQDTSSAIVRIGDALKAQQEQLNELRLSLQNVRFSPNKPVVHVPMQKEAGTAINTNKWNNLVVDQPQVVANTIEPAAASENPTPKTENIVQVLEFMPMKKLEPKPEPKVEEKPVFKPPPPLAPQSKSVESLPVLIPITFSMEQSPDLRAMNVVKVVASIDSNLPADEIIFALRKATASKVNLP